MCLTLFKVGLFNEIIDTAVRVRQEEMKNRKNRLNASVKNKQQFKNFLWGVKLELWGVKLEYFLWGVK